MVFLHIIRVIFDNTDNYCDLCHKKRLWIINGFQNLSKIVIMFIRTERWFILCMRQKMTEFS